MAKLSDLKKLFDETRAKAPAGAPSRLAARRGQRRISGVSAAQGEGRLGKIVSDPTGDIDLASAFADVRKLPPSTRAHHVARRPAPIPHQRIADDADALAASKYGAEPSPHAWEIGQEHEAGQTFLRRGLGGDVLTKLRRGYWAVQSEIDLHGHTTDEAHDALADFLDNARRHGYRCIRVIHSPRPIASRY